MMRKFIVSALIIVAVCGVGFYLYQHNMAVQKSLGIAQPNEAFHVSGYVMYKKAADATWSGLAVDTALEDGVMVKTSKESSAEIKFGKDMKNVIAAQEDTLIELDRISASGDKKIALKQGRLISDLSELDSGSRFEVRTPTAVCGVLGTSFEALADHERTIVKVYDGQVYVKGTGMQSIIGKEVVAREGTQVFIEKSQSPQAPIPLDQKDIDRWNQWKNDMPFRMFRTFHVFLNEDDPANNYYPSGWLGDYDSIRRFSWEENPRTGKNCLRFRYTARTPQGAGWAGVYWQNPVNNWGDIKGGFDLTGASKLTFWARGEKGGEAIVRFGMGGLSGKYPDSSKAEIGPVVLTREWRQYAIDLTGKDLSYISGGFYWMTDKNSNPDGAVLYLDDIKYE
jgi:hypothetical protein